MARRIRKSPWAASLQRALSTLTRAAVRAGTRSAVELARATAKAAAKTSARKPTPSRSTPTRARSAGAWVSGVAIGASGARRYRLFKPAGARKASPLPLLVMLHGCTQDAASFARSTRLAATAARAGFIALCPEQDRLANAQGCWNWFETRSGRAFNEAVLIVAAIDQACALHGADPARVVVAGFSAGASMAALLATRYPTRFKGVAMHSGVAPGAANSAATALRAMQGRGKPVALPHDTALPPLLVIHGNNDHVVGVSNGEAAALAWAEACAARPTATRVVQRGQRYPMTMTDFKRRSRTLVSLCEIAGLGHAWSGGAASQPYADAQGPDALRLIWAFAEREFQTQV